MTEAAFTVRQLPGWRDIYHVVSPDDRLLLGFPSLASAQWAADTLTYVHGIRCLTHHYLSEDARGHARWYWHCVPCDTGSDRYAWRRRRFGHKLESDAACGARQHTRDRRSARIAAVTVTVWYQAAGDACRARDWPLYLAAWIDNPWRDRFDLAGLSIRAFTPEEREKIMSSWVHKGWHECTDPCPGWPPTISQ